VDYKQRAAIAYAALGENLPQDAVYRSLSVDNEGKQLDGNSNYILHFEARFYAEEQHIEQ
jgi:hypothetical protein